jgi:hypothetical protein
MTTDALLHGTDRPRSLLERSLLSFCSSMIARLDETRLWRAAKEAAYYVNPSLQALARMSTGLPLPCGQWTRVAGNEVPAAVAEHIARRRFPAMSKRTLYVFSLQTELDVQDFERCFGLRQRSPER